MKQILLISLILVGMLLSACGAPVTTPTLTPAPTTDTLEQVVQRAWLNQAGTGMFFGTAPDLTTGTSQISYAYLRNDPGLDGSFGSKGTLNVLGLASQFPDKTILWLKFTCPGDGFGSLYVTFRVGKIQGNTEQYVTELSVPVDSRAGIVRFQMPSFSMGSGEYTVSAYTNGTLRFQRRMAYLAQGQQPDPNFRGGY